MAKYFTDFSENPVQSGVPSGWTQRVKAVSGDSINIATDATMGRVLKLNKSGTSGSFIISNNNLNGVSDLETLSLFKVEDTGQNGQFGINYNRFTGTSEATTNGMRTSLIPVSNVPSLVMADASVGVQQYTNFSWNLHTWYWARFRTVGTEMKSKVWAYGTPEPANWNLDLSYSKTLSNPYSGIGTFVRNNSVVFAQFSAGTNGDSAPMTDAEDTGWVSAGSASGTPLVLSDFDFNLPLDAEIKGIEVEVYAEGAIDAMAEVRLSPPSSQVESIYISNPGIPTLFNFGGHNQLWGGNWSRAQLESLYVDVTDIYKNVYVYDLKVKVYYKQSGIFPVPESSPIVGYTGGWGGAFNSFGSALLPATITNNSDITGNAKVERQNSSDIAGNAEIIEYFTTESITIAGKARITNKRIERLYGISRISKTIDTDILGNARIESVKLSTIIGNSRIGGVNLADITGKARIEAVKSSNIAGNAFIEVSRTATITGRAKVESIVSSNVVGNARISKTNSSSISGRGIVEYALRTTIAGNAKVEYINLLDISGRAKVEYINDTDISGNAFIEYLYDTDISGNAKVEYVNKSDIAGSALVETIGLSNILSNARIEKIFDTSIAGRSLIRNPIPIKLPAVWEENDVKIADNWSKSDKNATNWDKTSEKEKDTWEDSSTKKEGEWEEENTKRDSDWRINYYD